MTINRFVTSRALARPLRSALALAVALACVSVAQAQIPNQQRLLPTTAASAATGTAVAAMTTGATASAPVTASASSSDEGATHATRHTSYRKHVTHRRIYAAHKASQSHAEAPMSTTPQTHYEGTTVAAAVAPTAAPAPAEAPYEPPHLPVVDEHNYPPSEVGHSTNAWLSLQASNRDATHEEPMLGAAATAAYQRYIDSFKHPIPESYGSKLGGTGSGGSGQ